MVELERAGCPLCDGDASRVLFLARDRLMAVPGEFPVVECRGCGLVFVSPRPPIAALGKYYLADLPIRKLKPLQEGDGLRQRLLTRWARHGALKRVKWVENHVAPFRPGNTVLDVGCGTGAFLYWLRELRRAAAWGVDFSPDVVGYVRERLGIPVAQGTMETADLPPNTFDWVTLWDVIEHDPAPRATLAKVREVLKPDGFLVLETPNVQSPVARLFRRWWLEFGVVPRHLVFYSPRTLTALLSRCGFRVVKLSGAPRPGSFLISTLYALGIEGHGRGFPSASRHLPPLAVITLALPLLLTLGCLVPEAMRVVAQKTDGQTSWPPAIAHA